MPKLYIANTTKQRREFYYHPYSNTPMLSPQPHRRLILEPGRQEALPGDYPMDWISKLIERESRYGWLASSEVSRRNSRTAQIVWNIDRPVSESLISAIIEQNDAVLDDEAMQEQRRVAVAASQMDERLPTTNAPLPKAFDMNLEEMALRGRPGEIALIGKVGDNQDAINTTVEVRQGGRTSVGKGRGGRRKAA